MWLIGGRFLKNGPPDTFVCCAPRIVQQGTNLNNHFPGNLLLVCRKFLFGLVRLGLPVLVRFCLLLSASVRRGGISAGFSVRGVETLKADVRIIAATNADLEKAVGDSAFREDLYYRLAVIAIELPPLRERTEDIPLLARHFLGKYAEENEKPVKEIAPDAMEALLRRARLATAGQRATP